MKKLCDCGFPQSSPKPHEHSRPETRKFTDQDVKRAKEAPHILSDQDVIALLARMEAAEKALRFSLDEEEIVSGKMFADAMEAWRKSKGE